MEQLSKTDIEVDNIVEVDTGYNFLLNNEWHDTRLGSIDSRDWTKTNYDT